MSPPDKSRRELGIVCVIDGLGGGFGFVFVFALLPQLPASPWPSHLSLVLLLSDPWSWSAKPGGAVEVSERLNPHKICRNGHERLYTIRKKNGE